MLVSKAGLLCMFCEDGMNKKPFLSSEVSMCVNLKSVKLANLSDIFRWNGM